MNTKRESVKLHDRTNRERTLQRLRSECTERFAKERDSLKQRLRDSIDTRSVESVIRQGIESVRSGGSDTIDQADIDRLVDEFLNELNESPEYPDDDLYMDDEDTHPDWVKCPICLSGYLLIPFPGYIACDACNAMQMPLPSEAFSVSDFASALDIAIRNHQLSGCPGMTCFVLHNSSLILLCDACGPNYVFLVNR